LAEKILSDLKTDLEILKLVPGRGGCFEVWVDDDQIYSKLETGEFPEESKIVSEVASRNTNAA
jgi:selenoprotein W-related protein